MSHPNLFPSSPLKPNTAFEERLEEKRKISVIRQKILLKISRN